jgi:hypothetical protein
MKKIPRMGHGPPRLGRDILMVIASDPLRLYTVDYQLVAVCRRSGCDHRRELHTVGPFSACCDRPVGAQLKYSVKEQDALACQ